jgi:hypothetical protein
MNLLQLIKSIVISLVTDRTVQAGGATSTVSLFGARELTGHAGHIEAAQQWLAFYAAVIGALTATATLFYMVLKIRRMLKGETVKE